MTSPPISGAPEILLHVFCDLKGKKKSIKTCCKELDNKKIDEHLLTLTYDYNYNYKLYKL